MKMRMSTLCYIEKDNKYLMLHRVVKKNDVNKDKWIGVGGHFEYGESPEDCVLREVKEETGYTLTSFQYRGLVTFVFADVEMEYMSLFTADEFEGEPIPCNEGILEWVDIEDVWKLNLWEGDKIFFRLLDEKIPFFSLKLVYNLQGQLETAVLNGNPMEMFDVIDENGNPTMPAIVWLDNRAVKEAEEIEALIAARAAAKKEKNFAEADRIRVELLEKGITLIDTREGTKFKIGEFVRVGLLRLFGFFRLRLFFDHFTVKRGGIFPDQFRRGFFASD